MEPKIKQIVYLDWLEKNDSGFQDSVMMSTALHTKNVLGSMQLK